MEALLITIPVSIIFAIIFLGSFIWAVKSGQMDDLDTDKNIIFNPDKENEHGSETKRKIRNV